MPIHVDIRINNEYIKTVHIGRDENFAGNGFDHKYIVTDKVVNSRPDWYDMDAKKFTHTYSDGVEICVRKGLEAMYG